MGKVKIWLSGFVLSLVCITVVQAQAALKIGDKAPVANREVVDTSGRTLTLEEVSGDNGLLVLFTCNTCPWVTKWEDRYNSLAMLAQSNGIGVIGLNPNERIRNRGESMADMRKRAQKQGYNFPYALDKGHVIADAFGATRTPEIFLFKADMTLVYHGAIDDNADDREAVEADYAVDAINALANGQNISVKETKSLGCTIKRTE